MTLTNSPLFIFLSKGSRIIKQSEDENWFIIELSCRSKGMANKCPSIFFIFALKKSILSSLFFKDPSNVIFSNSGNDVSFPK